MKGDHGVYLRVVDYKSSAERNWSPSRMWYGLQLQLLLYLKAATAAGRRGIRREPSISP